MTVEDQEFDDLLRSRLYEEPSPDLASRIIAAAGAKPAVEIRYSLWDSVQELFAELLPSRPIYALAFTLACGFVLGFNDSIFLIDTANVDISELIYDDGAIL